MGTDSIYFTHTDADDQLLILVKLFKPNKTSDYET